MTTMDAAAPAAGRARPLTDGELAAAWWVGAAAAALGVLGFVNSFRAVARAAVSSFGELAPTVPLGIDLAIAVFSAMDIVLARLDMRPRWVRLIPWSLTGATVYLNVADQQTWFGRVAHAVFPALWVVAVSLAAHVIRVRAHLASGTAIDRIRVSRWVLAPAATALLWRRMVLWEIRSYPAALERERARVLALTGLQEAYGVLAWRWRAPRRVRALYRLGEHGTAGLAGDGVTPGATPGGSAGGHDLPAAASDDDPGAGVRARMAALRAGRTPIPEDGPGRGTRLAPRTEPGLVDRDAVVAALADEIRDAIEAGERWRPDYEALMDATGRRRSWCEKAVRDARMTVFDTPDDRTGGEARTDNPGQARTDLALAGAAGRAP
jgi:Protein of unknown function (DUF2637)